MGRLWRRLSYRIDEYFEVSHRGSSVATEVRGGFVTFLTMSYILLVNPQILTTWAQGSPGENIPDTTGMVYASDVATATALSCGVGCILVGLLANLPFAIGPGMGLNTLTAGMFVSICVQGQECNFDRAEQSFRLGVTTSFLMGAVVLALAVLNVTQLVLLVLPTTIKTAITVGIGAFQAFVGLRWMNVIQPGGDSLLKLEEFGTGGLDFNTARTALASSGWAQLLFAGCLLCMSVLFRRGVKGSILIAVMTTTALSWAFGIGGGEAVFPFKMPTLNRTPGQVRISEWTEFSARCVPPLVSMFLVTVFDVGGVQFGIAKAIDLPKAIAKARQDGITNGHDVNLRPKPEDSELLPGRAGQMVFGCVALTTMLSAALGCSPCIVFLECCAGVREGARTGLAAVVTGLIFFVACFFTPVFQHVPTCASAAPLVFVGCLMMGPVGEIEWNDLNHALPAFLCILMMPYTASITPGIVFGLAVYGVMALCSPREMMSRWRASSSQISTPKYSPKTIEGETYYVLQAPGSLGSDLSDAAESFVSSERRVVARLGRKDSTGALDIVQTVVVDSQPPKSPMDQLYRPTPEVSKEESIVSTALIGAPR